MRTQKSRRTYAMWGRYAVHQTAARGLVLALVFGTALAGCEMESKHEESNISHNFTSAGARLTGYSGTGGVVEIPDGITTIGSNAFRGCENVTGITMGNGVVKIESRAFYNCANLAEVTFSDSVTTIEAEAFWACPKLATVRIGTGLGSGLAANAFYGASNITKITVAPGNNALETTENNALIFKNTNSSYGKTLRYCFDRTKKTYVIKDAVKTVGACAFAGWRTLESVTFEAAVTRIDQYAFEDCTGLTAIELPNTVTTIANPFSGCTGLTNITVKSGGNPVLAVETGVLYQTKIGEITIKCLVFDPKSLTDTNYTLPDGVVVIFPLAFTGCNKIESVNLKSSVQMISNYAFQGCAKLNNLTIPASVKTIMDYAFYDCAALKKVTFSGTETAFCYDTTTEQPHISKKVFDGDYTAMLADNKAKNKTFERVWAGTYVNGSSSDLVEKWREYTPPK